MPTVPEQLPPILSLYRVGPGYALRIYDQAHTAIAVSVSKSLPPEAQFLQIITPTDMKLFQLNGHGQPAAAAEVEDEPTVGLMPPAPAPPADEDDDPMAEVRRLAATATDDAVLPTVSEVVGETPQGTKVVRRKKQSAGGSPAAGQDSPCGRCRGAGTIKTAMESGQFADVGCPVCSGSGVVKRYGGRR